MDILRLVRRTLGIGHRFLTFVNAEKRSLCMKYVTRLVWKPPATNASTTSRALVRKDTLLAWRMMASNPCTKSDINLSTASKPASTSMTSVLGFVYFLVNIAHKKAVRFLPCQFG